MTPADDPASAPGLKRRLDRTWPAFFARFGRLRPAQIAAMPALLDDANIVLCAATASGKTEAALAPLIERHCPPLLDGISPHTLRLVYLMPTRALVNDLHKRIVPALETLRLPLAVKTRDLTTFNPKRPAAVLLTTPESLDSLLASQPRLFVTLRAVIIDELHLFDGTARGDQLRVLLNRIRRILASAARAGDAPDPHVQYAALSATLCDPAAVADRYFPGAQVIQVEGGRGIAADFVDLSDDSALQGLFGTFRARGWRKALAFCNSRAEVERYAALTRARSPFGNAVYVHYSNLAPTHRREIEAAFGMAGAAICFASSTLELGIDIGDIDVVILIGAPGDPAAFAQRIGRGSRRTHTVQVVCGWRDPLERHLFEALTRQTVWDGEKPGAFQAGVAVQQLFSLLKQSRTGALRLAELYETFAGLLAETEIDALVGHLTVSGYLLPARAGEWRAGSRLDALADAQHIKGSPLSLHSNIRGQARTVEVRNHHTGQHIATVGDEWYFDQAATLEGRPVRIEWSEGDAIWVSEDQQGRRGQSRFFAPRQFLSADLARLLAGNLGFAPEQAPLCAVGDRWRFFHWLGDLYGEMVFLLLRPHLPVRKDANAGLYLDCEAPFDRLPALEEASVVEQFRRSRGRWESMLSLSPFHPLLPPELRLQSALALFDVARFLRRVRALHIERTDAPPLDLGDDSEPG